MFSKNIMEFLVIKSTSCDSFLSDQNCTETYGNTHEIYMEILMIHNIKNYEKL